MPTSRSCRRAIGTACGRSGRSPRSRKAREGNPRRRRGTMNAQDNVHIVREVFAAWNSHDVEGFVKRLDTKTVWESDAFPDPFAGHQGARQFFKLYVTAFPDLHLDIEQILAAGDSHVVVRWRSTGTHLGPLGDIPATGRKASNHGCTVMEVRNSKAAYAWVYFDNAHLLRQIGVLPGS